MKTFKCPFYFLPFFHPAKGLSAVKQKGEELLSLNHASKTVDVPASLPTPPHTNQEELR